MKIRPVETEEVAKESRTDLIVILGTLCILAVIIVLAVTYNSRGKPVEEACYAPLMTNAECANTCDGTCEVGYTTPNGLTCQRCVAFDDDTSLCPQGTSEQYEFCQDQCPGGLCMEKVSIQGTVCYSCFLCPDGLFLTKDKCDAQCGVPCEVGAQERQLTCWRCRE